MPALDFIIPGDLATRTGGYIYDRRMVQGLTARGWEVTVHRLDGDFPRPGPAALRDAGRVLARIPHGRSVVIDGLALGGMPALVEREAERLRLIGLVHHPLAMESGLAPETAHLLHEAERRALAAAQRVITTSLTTARTLASFDLPPERVFVVVPGADPAPLSKGSGGPTPNLLCVATLTARKGHALLFQALQQLREKAWCLCCVGSAAREPATARALHRQIAALGLEDRITLAGELEDAALEYRYRTADVFVLASHFEGYGMVLSEAIAHGLPVVATRAGAIPETVPESAGLLVPPNDVQALSAVLGQVLEDEGLRTRLAEGARTARRTLPTWEQACTRFAAVLESISAT